MTFVNLLTNKVVVARYTAISGDRTAYSTVTSEYVSIQRMSEERTVNLGGAIGKTYRLYAEENADIEVNDKLKDIDTGNEYKVKAVTIPASLGSFIHKECLIELVK